MDARRHRPRAQKIRLCETRGHPFHSISCDRCGRTRNVTGLCNMFPARYHAARLDEIEECLRCTVCGHRGGWIMATSAPDCGAPRQ